MRLLSKVGGFSREPQPCFAASCLVQESTDTRKRVHSVVALVEWILASQCQSKDTGPQHHEEVPIRAGVNYYLKLHFSNWKLSTTMKNFFKRLKHSFCISLKLYNDFLLINLKI